ncbi:MAG: 50S ribosomal protein L35ae [Nanoarchaeota archaeon]
MEAQIVNFRRGRHTQTNNQMLIKVSDIDKEKVQKLLNKSVIWKSSSGKKEIKGVITALHGNSGALRVRFERGLPGQAIGTKVKVE